MRPDGTQADLTIANCDADLPPGGPRIVGIGGPGFGDCWKSIQYVCCLCRRYGREIALYPLWHGHRGLDRTEAPKFSREPLIREMLDVLELPCRLSLVCDVPFRDVHVPDVMHKLWRVRSWTPTRRRWRGWHGQRFHRIAYQLDGLTSPELKNPPDQQVPQLLGVAPGYELIRLGKHLSVRACVEIASECDLFFGVDSGLLHLCYSTGIPVFVIQYGLNREWLFHFHGDRHAIQCADTADFLFKARLFLDLPGAPPVDA
jgi:hypothetical protein